MQKVRDYFLALDTNQQGTITLMELKRARRRPLKQLYHILIYYSISFYMILVCFLLYYIISVLLYVLAVLSALVPRGAKDRTLLHAGINMSSKNQGEPLV